MAMHFFISSALLLDYYFCTLVYERSAFPFAYGFSNALYFGVISVAFGVVARYLYLVVTSRLCYSSLHYGCKFFLHSVVISGFWDQYHNVTVKGEPVQSLDLCRCPKISKRSTLDFALFFSSFSCNLTFDGAILLVVALSRPS